MKTYYVVLTVVGWIDVFTSREYAQEMLAILKTWQEKRNLALYGYVIMSNRVHLVVGSETNEVDVFLNDFKAHSADRFAGLISKSCKEKRCDWLLHMINYFGKYCSENNHSQFWLDKDRPLELVTEEDKIKKIHFICNRPVVQGIVLQPEHYLLSSASPFSQLPVLHIYGREEAPGLNKKRDSLSLKD